MKALIFDVNGVLTDDLRIHIDVYDQVLRRYEITNGGQLVRQNIYLSTKGKIEFVLKENRRTEYEQLSMYVNPLKKAGKFYTAALIGRTCAVSTQKSTDTKSSRYIVMSLTRKSRPTNSAMN